MQFSLVLKKESKIWSDLSRCYRITSNKFQFFCGFLPVCVFTLDRVWMWTPLFFFVDCDRHCPKSTDLVLKIDREIQLQHMGYWRETLVSRTRRLNQQFKDMPNVMVFVAAIAIATTILEMNVVQRQESNKNNNQWFLLLPTLLSLEMFFLFLKIWYPIQGPTNSRGPISSLTCGDLVLS